ncbi:MAG: hypothetical protein QXU21_07515 [Candidatus Bathyarchaeia archaeon]
MWKFERIYRELLLCTFRGVSSVRQVDVALACGLSIGLVNKTVKKLEEAMAVEATRSGVRILSPARLLNLWATERNIKRDVWQCFRVDHIDEIEKSLPQSVVLSGFSAWALVSGRRPAEYDQLWFYVSNRDEFDFWFSHVKGKARKTNPNVFALYADDNHLFRTSQKGVVCLPQIYVDIYSIGGPAASPYFRDIVRDYPSLSLW